MPRYMIQKHDATHMHYDLRLEIDGVYRSWVIPKEIPTKPGDLWGAYDTPDHDLDYALEREIPQDEYGGGTQMLWDYGEWTEKDPIEEDKINFFLDGDRLEGSFSLIRSKNDPTAWMFMCHSAGVHVHGDISVLTGRTMEGIRSGAPFVPQASKLVSVVPEGKNWVYEEKIDGYRILAHRSGETVQLYTRNGKNWTDKYPEIVADLLKTDWHGWIDGEISYGDFHTTQNQKGTPHFWVFDKPDFEGNLLQRKAELNSIFNRQSKISVLPHTAEAYDPCKQGHEGLMAKRVDCSYKFGQRTCWAKYKCYNEQELVIGGYTKGSGKRDGMVGALLVGYYEDGVFRYAGKVGTGFTKAEASSLLGELHAQETEDNPFVDGPVRGNWVKPTTVAQIQFLDWTSAGRLRNPSFIGLREDKDPSQVFREYALTHPDKVLFSDAEATKVDLATYYAKVAERMVPDLVDRPLTLLRCPDGVENKCFFQRNAGTGRVPAGLKVVDVEGKRYYALADAEGLQSLAQLNVAEIHPWNSRASAPNHPDQMIFDLDPGDGVPWEQTTRAAFKVKEQLDQLGLKSFVRTSGNKGLHIVVPLDASQPTDVVRETAKVIAERAAALDPAELTTSSHGGARRKRVYIDWLRNDVGATTVASYSTRARSDATVATPISWDDVVNVRGDTYDIDTAPDTPGWLSFYAVKQSAILSTIFSL